MTAESLNVYSNLLTVILYRLESIYIVPLPRVESRACG